MAGPTHLTAEKIAAVKEVFNLFDKNGDDVVTEFIEGLVETYPGLQYLDGFPQIKFVIRADVVRGAYDKVAVISGGGSGHEPAHAGFVGPGMLTAAASGDVFASPPVDSVLAAIRAVTGPMGCLLIVKNYTGDRLNFGLAVKQAKSEGYKIEMVIVGDDCALPPPRGIAGRRGLAGTILVHKVAGAAADAGLSLADVAAEAKHPSEVVGTMGVALSICTLPGQVASNRLGPKQMELGLGIHGEPGVAVADLQPVDVVVEHVLKQILSQETQYLPLTRGSNAVILINGLGATPIIELMIAARKAVPELQLEYGIAVDSVYTGLLMTSLDMAGFSITIMKSDENILQRLDAPTEAPAWPVGSEGNRPPAKFPVPVPPSPSMKDDEILTQPQELSTQGSILGAAIEAGTKEIIKIKDSLNEWDSKVGDGDCGTTTYRGAASILEDMKKWNDILCSAAYGSLKQKTTITTIEWSNALEASVTAVSKYGGASEGYRTMLDALIPACTVLKQRLKAGDDPLTAFITSSEAASAGAESTKQMQAKEDSLLSFERGNHDVDCIRNTVTLNLDGNPKEVLKRYIQSIAHLRLWFVKQGLSFDLSSRLGYEKLVHVVPRGGSFFFILKYEDKSVTLVIDARGAWLEGGAGSKSIFQFRRRDEQRYIRHQYTIILKNKGEYTRQRAGEVPLGAEPLIELVSILHGFDGTNETEERVSANLLTAVQNILEPMKFNSIYDVVCQTIESGSTTTLNKEDPHLAIEIKRWGKAAVYAGNKLLKGMPDSDSAMEVPQFAKWGLKHVQTIDDLLGRVFIMPRSFIPKSLKGQQQPFDPTIWSPTDPGVGDSFPLENLYKKITEELHSGHKNWQHMKFIEDHKKYFSNRAGGKPCHQALKFLDQKKQCTPYSSVWKSSLPVQGRALTALRYASGFLRRVHK